MDCRHNENLIPDISEIKTPQPGVCPVDWARKGVQIANQNNCGQSVLCRDGLVQIGLIIDDVVSGKGQPDDIPLIREICEYIKTIGGCEIAKRAAENVLYTMEQYADEWDMHCRRKRCSAMVCKAYYAVYCMPEKCQGCTACMKVCPVGAIRGGEGLICVVDSHKCIRCGKCFEVCPHEARDKYVAVKPRLPEEPVPVGSQSETPVNRRRRRNRESV